VSATEWSASAIMPEEPVMTAPTNFNTAITPLAKSAPSTASIQRVLQVARMKAPSGLSRKNGAKTIQPQIIIRRPSSHSLGRLFHAFFTFEFSALQKADEFAIFADDGERADAVAFHQLAGVVDCGCRFDEKSGSDRPHDVAGTGEMPTF